MTAENWVDTPEEEELCDGGGGLMKQWKFRLLDWRNGGRINGPHDEAITFAWNDTGHFGEELEYREIRNEGRSFGC